MFPCNGLDQSCQAHSLSVKVSLPYAWLPLTLLVGLCLFTLLGISRADLVVKHFHCPSLVDQAWSIKTCGYQSRLDFLRLNADIKTENLNFGIALEESFHLCRLKKTRNAKTQPKKKPFNQIEEGRTSSYQQELIVVVLIHLRTKSRKHKLFVI